eukprot:scaffold178905_cov32-Tisochrysis_lutea.AAC.1
MGVLAAILCQIGWGAQARECAHGRARGRPLPFRLARSQQCRATIVVVCRRRLRVQRDSHPPRTRPSLPRGTPERRPPAAKHYETSDPDSHVRLEFRTLTLQ